MSLKTLLSKRSKAPNWVIVVLLAASGVGFLDATYLSVKHFVGSTLSCSVLDGCGNVLTSSYSVVGPVPVALIGSIYYALVFVFTVAYIDLRRSEVIVAIACFTIAGFIATLWFVYLQVFVIHALCLYCMLSAVTATLLFVAGVRILKLRTHS